MLKERKVNLGYWPFKIDDPKITKTKYLGLGTEQSVLGHFLPLTLPATAANSVYAVRNYSGRYCSEYFTQTVSNHLIDPKASSSDNI